MPLPSGRIFVYDNISAQLSVYQDFFDSRSLPMFGTDNIYKLTKYSAEISPGAMIFNLNRDSRQVLSALKQLSANGDVNFPVIVLNPYNIEFKPTDIVSHYLTAPINPLHFMDIIESYYIGGKRHQILLLNSISETPGYFQQRIKSRGYSYFEVHNGIAANLYLQKNMPKIVCIEYNASYIIERHNLQHDHIFYVDRQQDIDEIEFFLN